MPNKRPITGWLCLLSFWMLPSLAVSAETNSGQLLSVPWADVLEAHYYQKQLIYLSTEGIDAPAAIEIRDGFVGKLQRQLGPVIGYKASLISKQAQQKFGVTTPLRGTFLAKMFHPSGATLDVGIGVTPLIEADLLLRVSDEAINAAQSSVEVLAGIDAIIPFIEIPDLLWPEDGLNASKFLMANCGARAGVIGEPIPLAAGLDWQERLKSFSVKLSDQQGNDLGEGKGSDLMGDPLAVVLWISKSLAAEGKRLKVGDLLSLGSLTPPTLAKSGSTLTASYEGLDGPMIKQVRVSFR